MPETGLLKRFENLFGEPKDIIIYIGIFEQHEYCKYKTPVKGKGFRTLLCKAGYNIYLADKIRNNCCRCSECDDGECKTFRGNKNKKPYVIQALP